MLLVRLYLIPLLCLIVQNLTNIGLAKNKEQIVVYGLI